MFWRVPETGEQNERVLFLTIPGNRENNGIAVPSLEFEKAIEKGLWDTTCDKSVT